MAAARKPPLPPSDRRRYARKIDPAVSDLLVHIRIEYKLKAKWCHKFTKALAHHVLTKIQSIPKKKPDPKYAQRVLLTKLKSRASKNPNPKYHTTMPQLELIEPQSWGSPNPNNPTLPRPSMKPKPYIPTPPPPPTCRSQSIQYLHFHATLFASLVLKEFKMNGQWSNKYNYDLVQLALDKLRSNSPPSTNPPSTNPPAVAVAVDVDDATASPSKKL